MRRQSDNEAVRSRVEIGERDLRLFEGLYEARVMLRAQAAELFFSGNMDATHKRLQKLLKYGYLREKRHEGRQSMFLPRWLSLTERAFDELKLRGRVDERTFWQETERRLSVAPSKLLHDLAVVDLWVAFARAGRVESATTLKYFSTWPHLYRFETRHPVNGLPLLLMPDAFAVLAVTDDPGLAASEYSFFLEWDRSTQRRDVLGEKAVAYDAFYRSGSFAERSGGKALEADAYPFRVIFALHTEERRNNLLEALCRRSAPHGLIRTLFWATTHADILGNPLGPIFLNVQDYASATQGTHYDPSRFVTAKREYHRDELVRERAVKQRLIQ